MARAPLTLVWLLVVLVSLGSAFCFVLWVLWFLLLTVKLDLLSKSGGMSVCAFCAEKGSPQHLTLKTSQELRLQALILFFSFFCHHHTLEQVSKHKHTHKATYKHKLKARLLFVVWRSEMMENTNFEFGGNCFRKKKKEEEKKCCGVIYNSHRNTVL